jgi:hypothetical protein
LNYEVATDPLLQSEKILCSMGEKRNACWILVEKPEGKKPIGKPRLKWEDNAKIILDGVVWMDSSGSG